MDRSWHSIKDSHYVTELFADNKHPPKYYIRELENCKHPGRSEQNAPRFCTCIERDLREEYLVLSIGVL